MGIYIPANGFTCGTVDPWNPVGVHAHGTVKVLLGYEEHYLLFICHALTPALDGTLEAEAPSDVFHTEVNLHAITVTVYVSAATSYLPQLRKISINNHDKLNFFKKTTFI